jgi:hypothetical protein
MDIIKKSIRNNIYNANLLLFHFQNDSLRELEKPKNIIKN